MTNLKVMQPFWELPSLERLLVSHLQKTSSRYSHQKNLPLPVNASVIKNKRKTGDTYTLLLEAFCTVAFSSLSESELDESLGSLGVGFFVGFSDLFTFPFCGEGLMKRYD